MGLIVEGAIQRSVAVREDVAPFHLLVDKHRLSMPYEISPISNAFASGSVLDVKVLGRTPSEDEKRAIEFVVGKTMEFFVGVGLLGSYDYLYFTRPSWALLRNAGLITPEYSVRIKLVKLRIGETEQEIYALRDVT